MKCGYWRDGYRRQSWALRWRWCEAGRMPVPECGMSTEKKVLAITGTATSHCPPEEQASEGGQGWGPALRSAMTKLDKDPKTQTKLRDISRAVREAEDSGSKLVDKNGCRVTQSILKGSNIPPGGWLPGNSGMPAADPAHLADHAVRDVVQASAESDAVVALPEAVLDAVEDKVEEYFKRPEEDHLVNINAQVKR